MGIGDGSPIDNQTAGRGAQQEGQANLDAVAIPAEWGTLELAAQLVGWDGSLVVAGLGQASTECAGQRVAFVQRTIVFVDTQILQIIIGRIAIESGLDGRLLIEDAIRYFCEAGIDAGK